MMVLDVCHTSFSFKLDDATDSITALTLSSSPSDNISKFTNEVQRSIKMMKRGYDLQYQLGSQLVLKSTKTQSDYFNRSIFNLMDNALAIEKSHGPHRDPKLLEKTIK